MRVSLLYEINFMAGEGDCQRAGWKKNGFGGMKNFVEQNQLAGPFEAILCSHVSVIIPMVILSGFTRKTVLQWGIFKLL